MVLLKWAAVAFVLAIIFGVFGFAGIAEGFADIAAFLFYAFLIIVAILVIAGLVLFRKVT